MRKNILLENEIFSVEEEKLNLTPCLVLNAFQLFFLKKYFLVRELKMEEILEI